MKNSPIRGLLDNDAAVCYEKERREANEAALKILLRKTGYTSAEEVLSGEKVVEK